MVRFWDTSALVPLIVDEPATRASEALLGRDPEVATWWGAPVECVSAIARLERDGALQPDMVVAAMDRLDALAATWQEIQPTAVVRIAAIRLLRLHALRAADALQLAAAGVFAEGHPEASVLVTRDERLAGAASRQGFRVERLGSRAPA